MSILYLIFRYFIAIQTERRWWQLKSWPSDPC